VPAQIAPRSGEYAVLLGVCMCETQNEIPQTCSKPHMRMYRNQKQIFAHRVPVSWTAPEADDGGRVYVFSSTIEINKLGPTRSTHTTRRGAVIMHLYKNHPQCCFSRHRDMGTNDFF